MPALAGMYLLARRKPGRRVMGWATAVTGIVVAAYSATPAAELGRYQSRLILIQRRSSSGKALMM